MVTSSFLLKAADAKIEHYKWLDLLVNHKADIQNYPILGWLTASNRPQGASRVRVSNGGSSMLSGHLRTILLASCLSFPPWQAQAA
ncbi:MAG TPA: hypothetical protein VIJ25_20785 [Methylococcales bacterium]